MKKNGFKWIIVIIIIRVIATNIIPAVTVSSNTQQLPPMGETMKQEILGTTVQIMMYFPSAVLDEMSADQQVIKFTAAVGLGTVGSQGGRSIIITHDHWGHPMSEIVFVEFRNAQNELLGEVEGATFGNLIRYRDGGTMILMTPDSLQSNLNIAPLGIPQRVTPGDMVVVVRQQPGNESHTDVLGAVVDSIGIENGNATFELRSLGGQAIVRGDSGGGVYLDGQLIGNLWSTEIATGKRYLGFLTIESDKDVTDMSTVASLPVQLLDVE